MLYNWLHWSECKSSMRSIMSDISYDTIIMDTSQNVFDPYNKSEFNVM